MNVYEIVTERILAELEKGKIPWEKPWIGGIDCPIKHTTGEPYSILNQILLGEPGEYLTMNQCNKEGGRIKKGAKAKLVVFWKMLEKEDEKNKDKKQIIPMLRYYNVFHINDCEGIKPKFEREQHPNGATKTQNAENIVSEYSLRTNLEISHANQLQAYYMPYKHLVNIPDMDRFKSTEGYYSTFFHELVHSTGNKKLLNRFPDDAKQAAFGSDSYSREELVAEIGANMLLNTMGMDTDKSNRNSVAYIQSWLRALKNDKRLIVSAAGHAEKAVKLILNSGVNA